MQLLNGHRRGLHAGRAFGLLAFLFIVAFGVAVMQLVAEQQHVLQINSRLQSNTVPEIVRYQRLARSLEQLRQEGERIFAAGSHASRQQSMFVVTMIASHPGVLDYPAAASLSREVEAFLGEVVRQSVDDSRRPADFYDEWQRLAPRLGALVDEVSVQGTNLASAELNAAADAVERARLRLMIALLLVGLFLLTFMVLVRRHLIRPLQQIDQALSGLSVDRPAPTFAPSWMREIQAVEEAVCEQHALLIQNEEVRQTLENLANKDGLTGLMNRRHFMQTAEAELQRAQRYRRPVTVAMADLDYFKKLNDTYGHAAGDLVLATFAERVRDTLRQSDLVCRYGGEEFAFLFPEITPTEAGMLAERLRQKCATQAIDLPDGRSVTVTVSMGLADASESPIEIALKHADEALYEAKDHGRNRVMIATPGEIVQKSLDLPDS